MLAVLALASLVLHTVWWSGNLYEAVVIAPPWLGKWRRGQPPGVRIDPRAYYIPPGLLGPASAIGAAGLGFADSSSARWWLALAAAASLIAAGWTVYIVVAHQPGAVLPRSAAARGARSRADAAMDGLQHRPRARRGRGTGRHHPRLLASRPLFVIHCCRRG